MAKRKSNSTAITTASDIGRPYRNPKAYKPATKTQQRIIAAAVTAAIPGGAAVRGAMGVRALLGRAKSSSAGRVTPKKDDWSSAIDSTYSARNIRAAASYRATKSAQKGIETPRRAAARQRGEAADRRQAERQRLKRFTTRDSGKTGSKRSRSGATYSNMAAKAGVKSGQLPRGYTSASVTPRVGATFAKKGKPPKNRPPLKGARVIKRGFSYD